MTDRNEHALITDQEREIITLVAGKFSWGDLEFDGAAVNLGPFAMEKFDATVEELFIGGCRRRPTTVWVLLETVFCSGYPSEPDYDDIAEFDEVTGSVWAALERLRQREKEWEVRNEIDNIALPYSFQKDPTAEEY